MNLKFAKLKTGCNVLEEAYNNERAAGSNKIKNRITGKKGEREN